MSTILLIYAIATALVSIFIRPVREMLTDTYNQVKGIRRTIEMRHYTESKLKIFGLKMVFILRILLLVILFLILILPLFPLTFLTAERRLKSAKKKLIQLESKMAVEKNGAKRKKYETTIEHLKEKIRGTEIQKTWEDLKRGKIQPTLYGQDILY
jgi:hypothetical protein